MGKLCALQITENVFISLLAFYYSKILGETDDVRRYCESAMAIVENSTRVVSPVKCEMVSASICSPAW